MHCSFAVGIVAGCCQYLEDESLQSVEGEPCTAPLIVLQAVVQGPLGCQFQHYCEGTGAHPHEGDYVGVPERQEDVHFLSGGAVGLAGVLQGVPLPFVDTGLHRQGGHFIRVWYRDLHYFLSKLKHLIKGIITMELYKNLNDGPLGSI